MSKPINVTQWFDMKVAPEHDGVYQIKVGYIDFIFYARFEKGCWCCLAAEKSVAAREIEKSICCYEGHAVGWRGLAEKPDKYQGAKP